MKKRIILILFMCIILVGYTMLSCQDIKTPRNQTLTEEKKNNNFDTLYCKCSYFTDSSINLFFSKRDSISNVLLKTNDSVIVFGFHEKFEKLLFISNKKK